MSPFTFLLLSFISSFPSQCMDHCRIPSNSSVFLMSCSLPLIQSVLNAAAKLMVRLLLSSLISSFVHFPTYTLASTSWLVPKYYKVLLLILFWLISATSVICRPHAVTSLRPLQSSLSRPICLTAENIRPTAGDQISCCCFNWFLSMEPASSLDSVVASKWVTLQHFVA